MSEPKKQTGILWKLNAEEKKALREVCQAAMQYALEFNEKHIGEKIRQLLGEEWE